MQREPQSSRDRTAFDLKKRFNWLEKFNDDELRRISLCPDTEMLQPGEEYVDISHPEQGIIRIERERRAPEDSCFVARSRVGDHLWSKLLSAKSGRMRRAG